MRVLAETMIATAQDACNECLSVARDEVLTATSVQVSWVSKQKKTKTIITQSAANC